MRVFLDWIDHERWQWFAAGDSEVETNVVRSPSKCNSQQQVLFETGLTLLIPLAAAASIKNFLGT